MQPTMQMQAQTRVPMQMQHQCNAIANINASAGAISMQVRGQVHIRRHASAKHRQNTCPGMLPPASCKANPLPPHPLHPIRSNPSNARNLYACIQPVYMYPTSIHASDKLTHPKQRQQISSYNNSPPHDGFSLVGTLSMAGPHLSERYMLDITEQRHNAQRAESFMQSINTTHSKQVP